jgi:hypothetical protein
MKQIKNGLTIYKAEEYDIAKTDKCKIKIG